MSAGIYPAVAVHPGAVAAMEEIGIDISSQEKMQEYINNGTLLGWLINRKDQQVEIYRPNKDIEILDYPQSLSGENILTGFTLDLKLIW